VPTRSRMQMITRTEYVMDGLKMLCDAGRVETAYMVLENLVSAKTMPLFVSHMAFMPQRCHVVPASKIFRYEASKSLYLVIVEGFSVQSGREEVSCIAIDDMLFFARLCTHRELEEVINAWKEGRLD